MKRRLKLAGKTYDIVTIDFESFYSKDFTLKKLSTSEYIRDARFKAHGVGIKINDGPTRWYTGKNIPLALRAIDWSKSAKLCHHTHFDGLVSSHWFDIIPALYLCTLSMSRAVHGHHVRHSLDQLAKRHGLLGKVRADALADTKGKLDLTSEEERRLGGYCVNDVDDTYKLFWMMHDHVPDEELQLIDLTVRMFCRPLLHVDLPRVRAELDREIGSKAAALELAGAHVDDLMSDKKFAQLLKAEGAQLPMKISPSTGALTYTFAKNNLEFQALAESPNKRIAALCKARLRIKSTLGETRAARFLEAGKDGMRMPVYLNYCGAHTTRWSGGNKINLQNLPRKGELRKSLLAPDGYVVVVADSSQIEARTAAELAGETSIVEAFRRGEDVYCSDASEIFGRVITKKDEDERFVGKVYRLQLMYGSGAVKLEHTLASGAMGKKVVLPPETCQHIVNVYRSRNPRIVAAWRKCDNIIEAMASGVEGTWGPISYGKNYIRLPSGLFMHYPSLRGDIDDRGRLRNVEYWNGKTHTRIYGAMLFENIVQALARCVVAEQMLVIAQQYPVVLMTHDECGVIARIKDAERCQKLMLKTMSTPPVWMPNLPVGAEAVYARYYAK